MLEKVLNVSNKGTDVEGILLEGCNLNWETRSKSCLINLFIYLVVNHKGN